MTNRVRTLLKRLQSWKRIDDSDLEELILQQGLKLEELVKSEGYDVLLELCYSASEQYLSQTKNSPNPLWYCGAAEAVLDIPIQINRLIAEKNRILSERKEAASNRKSSFASRLTRQPPQTV